MHVFALRHVRRDERASTIEDETQRRRARGRARPPDFWRGHWSSHARHGGVRSRAVGPAFSLHSKQSMAGRVALAGLVILTSCAGADPGHDEPSDFDPVDWTPDGKGDFGGVPAVFDRNNIMDDVVFATPAVSGDELQGFLERSPYGTRSWLADARLDGKRFSDDLVAIAAASGIDPVVLLARAQVESSIVSATRPPSKSRTDIALGCGCADSQACASQFLGLGNQLRCAGTVLSKKDGESAAGTGEWRKNHAKRTSDPLVVTPKNDATAALYAYTPWVLQGRGGNCEGAAMGLVSRPPCGCCWCQRPLGRLLRAN